MSADIWECQARSARAGIQVICSGSHRRDISLHAEDCRHLKSPKVAVKPFSP